MKKHRFLGAAVAAATALPGTAYAQDEGETASGAWEVDAAIAALTDYRFRGVSLSGKDPEITAEVTVSHESGFYAGTWLSNVDLGDGADDLEADLFVGFATDLGGASIDIGATYYLYPSDGDFNYVEFAGSIGTSIGPATVTVGVAYAPSQDALGNVDNTYVYISGEVPIGGTPLTLHGTFGYEDGGFADNKKDWLVGASFDMGAGFTATLDYVDTAHSFTSLGDATAVFSISKSF
ncbi:hypothetical protein H0274_00210 [Altererythrobacter sp. CC-YST694]|uniref:TorF family putative porin n=1 Tax=Altererythrobacter sp. CC-YST694 TaxID=2755038 RepID=UPI001D00F7BE|nr:TorF family putative porin [Altererythrobacter sp. CC-YST694]MCB5423663.1 hypothetical protein [Altererythrobacter sp. CC-YST694]